MIFNERLRRLRKERGLTQVQTAEHLSIAWRNYQRLEKDGNAPSFLTFVKAAEFFGVSLDYLAVHSVLHLLGYDHMDEGPMKAQMRRREEHILEGLGIRRG